MTKSRTKTLVFTTLDILQLIKIDVCESIDSVNPLYLRVNHVNGYIEEKGDENKELLKKYNDIFNGIRVKIKEVCSDE